MYGRRMGWVWVLVMGIMSVVMRLANGQTIPLCAQQLFPCVYFMNSTNPPDTCCNPIKQINETQKTCFCQIVLTPGMLEGFGTSTAQALQLLQLCGVNFTITTCKASSSAPPPSMVKPPAMSGGDEGGASRTTFTGFFFALFFFCACVLFS